VGTCTDREEKRALVTQTLNSASLALTKATNSIGALDAILARIASATADTLNIASNEYLALMSGGTLPGAAELANAQSNSQDTGSVEPGSLYSQMTRIARECGS